MSTTTSASDKASNRYRGRDKYRIIGGWMVALIACYLLIGAAHFGLAIALIFATDSLDVAHTLGVSDNLLNGSLLAIVSLLVGSIFPVLARYSGWAHGSAWRPAAPASALVVGQAIFLTFVAMGSRIPHGPEAAMVAWAGISVAIVVATRLTGAAWAGTTLALLVVAVGAVAIIETIPEPSAEVALVVEDYTVDQATGECSGAGELSGVVEGSLVSLTEMGAVSTELGTVALPAGVETQDGCSFNLGRPLDLTAFEYSEAMLWLSHKSDPDSWQAMDIDGHRVTFTLGSE